MAGRLVVPVHFTRPGQQAEPGKPPKRTDRNEPCRYRQGSPLHRKLGTCLSGSNQRDSRSGNSSSALIMIACAPIRASVMKAPLLGVHQVLQHLVGALGIVEEIADALLVVLQE